MGYAASTGVKEDDATKPRKLNDRLRLKVTSKLLEFTVDMSIPLIAAPSFWLAL